VRQSDVTEDVASVIDPFVDHFLPSFCLASFFATGCESLAGKNWSPRLVRP